MTDQKIDGYTLTCVKCIILDLKILPYFLHHAMIEQMGKHRPILLEFNSLCPNYYDKLYLNCKLCSKHGITPVDSIKKKINELV